MSSFRKLGGYVGSFMSLSLLVACGSDGGGGGSASTGGTTGNGGISSSGGISSTGGAYGTGGVSSSGGTTGSGGTSNTGGADVDGSVGPDGSTGGAASTGGATSSGGATSTGGATGTGGAPFVPTGSAMTAQNLTWTWVDFPDTKCRDGSTSGLGLSLNSASDKVMIYLEGGGACFNSLTCFANPANAATQKGAKTAGIFDRSNVKNPVKDWNFVYVPYCTGDIHAGTNDNGSIAGVLGQQHFVGRLNMEAYLNRVVPTFPNATKVLLTGISAGGFGAASSADLVQWAFGSIPVTLIDDSGPPMSSQYIPTCLQDAWRTTWGFDNSILKDCGADCPNNNDYVMDFALHLGKKFYGRPSGLIETTGDGIITFFYGFGANNCGVAASLSATTFTAGLMDFRAQISNVDPAFGTFYITGTEHTWLGGGSLYTQTTGGVALIDWVANIVNGVGAPHVGP